MSPTELADDDLDSCDAEDADKQIAEAVRREKIKQPVPTPQQSLETKDG